MHNDKHYSVELKRGQCILKISKISEELELDRSRIKKSLEILSKYYTKLNIKGMPYGCIITMLDYDTVVNLNNEDHNDTTIKQQSSNNKATANKSVKKEKSVKKDTLLISEEIKLQFLSAWNKERGGRLQSVKQFERNLEYWLSIYSIDDICEAITRIRGHDFWGNKTGLDPTWFLRTKDRSGNPVDYIGQMLATSKHKDDGFIY